MGLIDHAENKEILGIQMQGFIRSAWLNTQEVTNCTLLQQLDSVARSVSLANHSLPHYSLFTQVALIGPRATDYFMEWTCMRNISPPPHGNHGNQPGSGSFVHMSRVKVCLVNKFKNKRTQDPGLSSRCVVGVVLVVVAGVMLVTS